MSTHRKAIVLMNLGSPDSPAVKDVKKYLTEFLMDKRVIDSPYLVRCFVVKGLIVPFRAANSAEAYHSVWTKDGSPLIVLTKQLQEKLQENFHEPVEICMRYGNPSSEYVLQELHTKNPALEELVLFPLYPHYAMSSYETAVEDIRSVHAKKGYNSRLTVIKPFYNNDLFIHALAESIRPYLQDDFDKILFSYHGLPERHIKKSDITGHHCLQLKDCCEVSSPAHAYCYRHQTFTTTKLVTTALNLPPEKFEQTFQSRLGRDPWLTPYTAMRLTELPGEGVKKLLVVCPAFVSDCLETLEEIAIQGKESFLEAGGESLTAIPCLNTHPLWVEAMVRMVKPPAPEGEQSASI
jgi:ferrochelatase